MKKFFISACLAVLSALLGAQEIPKELNMLDVLGRDCSLFNKADPATLLARKPGNLCAMLFRWTSDKQDDARYPGYANSPKLTLFSLPVCEMNFRFKNGKADNLYVMYYNRGDLAPIGEGKFESLTHSLVRELSEFTGEKGVEKTGKLSKDDRITRHIWLKDDFIFEAKWSIRKIKNEITPEYLQLEIYRFDPKLDPRKQDVVRTGAQSGAKKKPAENVVRDKETGEVFIDGVPMVDQGTKGYCVPAVIERILRYYGNEDATQHTIAQLSGSDASGGTSTEEMLKQVKRAGPKLGVKTNVLYQRVESPEDFEKLLKKYNACAKKNFKGKKNVRPVIRDNTYYIQETVAQMDPEVELKMWSGEKAELKKFHRAIRENVEKGIPVVWCVDLGKYPEEKLNPQTAGGHMRLIIGYNEKEKTVCFSDSWGSGHEKKTMPEEQAWAMTQMYFILLPRK